MLRYTNLPVGVGSELGIEGATEADGWLETGGCGSESVGSSAKLADSIHVTVYHSQSGQDLD
jgi:hypothetical protein